MSKLIESKFLSLVRIRNQIAWGGNRKNLESMQSTRIIFGFTGSSWIYGRVWLR